MTNEEEREFKEFLQSCRNNIHKVLPTAITEHLLDLAEHLLKENSALRVRDSNVTMHSLNVMAVNEDLVGRKCGTCKHWDRLHQASERDYAVCNQIARELVFETVDDQPEFAWTDPSFTCGLWEKP